MTGALFPIRRSSGLGRLVSPDRPLFLADARRSFRVDWVVHIPKVSPAQRARLRLRKRAKEVPLRPVHVFRSFSDLKQYAKFVHPDTRAFLEGSFIWELGIHRRRELLETPEGMASRLADVELLDAT